MTDMFQEDAKQELQLYRYNGYQVDFSEVQDIEIMFLPTDEAIRQILYEIDDEELKNELMNSPRSIESFGTDDLQNAFMNKIKDRAICTESWNPLIFAIFYGRIDIVEYILTLAEQVADPAAR